MLFCGGVGGINTGTRIKWLAAMAGVVSNSGALFFGFLFLRNVNPAPL